MSDLFKDKYRIESTRLPGWDYASSGFYFVTICTHERAHYFGDVLIDNNGMTSVALSNIGKIARDCWLDISNHFPNASLDEWVVMPNHVHGIIVINQNDNQRNDFCRDVACNVSTNPRAAGVDIKHASSDERKKWMSYISPAP